MPLVVETGILHARCSAHRLCRTRVQAEVLLDPRIPRVIIKSVPSRPLFVSPRCSPGHVMDGPRKRRPSLETKENWFVAQNRSLRASCADRGPPI